MQLGGAGHGDAVEELREDPAVAGPVGGLQPVTLGEGEARGGGT